MPVLLILLYLWIEKKFVRPVKIGAAWSALSLLKLKKVEEKHNK